ncbi:MAG: sigma 54-interacting transcriptional regulator [Mycobacterium leprae]
MVDCGYQEVRALAFPPIVFVLPFPELAEMAAVVAGELGVPVACLVGDLDQGVEQARNAAAGGAEVIISRGGTAKVIAESVDLPVVEIRVTSSDVLRAFKELSSFQGTVALAGFRNVTYGCEEVGNLLGLQMVHVPVPSQEEAYRVIAEAQEAGVAHVIGDHISYLCARKLGMGATLIQSGREGIAQALFEAEHVMRVRREEREKASQVRIIFDTVADGILAINGDARVILFNPAAERAFGINSEAVLGRPVTDVIPGTRLPEVLKDGKPQIGEIQQVGQTRLATTRMPVQVGDQIVGAVATFHDVTELQRYEQLVRQKLHRHGLVAKNRLEQIVGPGKLMQRVLADAGRYAPTDATVLILGESGTGKELLAQGIHNASRRRQGPFVAINCAAMPETLLESELFGYEEGAFTGARKGGKQGLFELAHGGTIFLDEVGEMPPGLQARLLRVLQEKEVMRVGGSAVIPVDVRVVAATNRDLAAEVAEGRFRADLFYRLDILRLEVPPLRLRLEDIPALVEALGARLHQKYARRVRLTPQAVAALTRHAWPGNVRQLENILERLVLVADGELVDENVVAACLPGASTVAVPEADQSAAAPISTGNWPEDLTLAELEALAIQRALSAEGGNLQRAAARLGLHRTTLYRKLMHHAQNDA